MLKIVGDCNFADGFFDMGFGTGTLIKNGSDPFQYIKGKAKDDFWIGNFECVCSGVSAKEGTEAIQFIIAPEACNHVNHLDLYGVANNHVMQHGVEAYQQMVDYIGSKGVLFAGTQDKPSIVFEHQGKKVINHNGKESRIVSLLKLLHLEDRIFDSVEELSKSDCWKKVIDYNNVDYYLSALKNQSETYLKLALNIDNE